MRKVLVSVLVVAASLVFPLNAASATPTECASLEVVAHRGFHGPGYDENALPGFSVAAARGYTIETDVWADAEGQLWIFHDRDVSRATGSVGLIDQMTTAQVAALRYKKAKSPLPRFEEAIALWQTHPGTRVYIEPKQQSIVPRVAQAFRDAGLAPSTYFTSFTALVERTEPDMQIMVRSSTSAPDPTTLAAQGVDVVALTPNQTTTSVVDAYHEVGVEVQTKTANLTREWRPVIAAGTDAVLTDFPDELTAFCPSALLPPAISSLSPSSGPVGTKVTISGSNFTDATRVQFGNVASVFTVDSSSKITATVPDRAPTSPSALTVTTPNGAATSSGKFTVTNASTLAISSFAPASGAEGTSVTITGSGFTGATQVLFGTVPASFSVVGPTQITATVPAGAPSQSAVSVAGASGSVQSAQSFSVVPTISSFTPSSATPGGVVTITGTSFTGATRVLFGTVAAASFTVDSATRISATVPSGAPGRARITVATPGGSVLSSQFFSVPPTISSFTPSSATAGAVVTITGTSFTGATRVLFGTVAAASFTVDSATQITATVPSGAPGRAKILVGTPGGSVQSSQFFSVPPTISSFTPSSATAGAVVTITGTSFTGATRVLFGTVAAASFTVDSATQIRATTPSAATPGLVKLQVTTPGGTVQSSDSLLLQ